MQRRAEVVARMKQLEEAASPIIAFLQDPSLVAELRQEKQQNLKMLHDRFQVRRQGCLSTPWCQIGGARCLQFGKGTWAVVGASTSSQ
jgi:hypothetical protein